MRLTAPLSHGFNAAMNESRDARAGSGDGGSERQRRLAAALRENLRRRKAQGRARAEGAEAGDGARGEGGTKTTGRSP